MSQGKLTIRCLIKGSNTSPRSRLSAAGMAESFGLKVELSMSIIQWGCVVEIECGSGETTKICRVGALILETPDNLSKGPGRNGLIFNIQNVETEEKDKVYRPTYRTLTRLQVTVASYDRPQRISKSIVYYMR